MSPELDPENRANLVSTVFQTVNSLENLFPGARFEVDEHLLLEHMKASPEDRDELEDKENAKPERPFSGHDARRVVDLSGWLEGRHERAGNRLTARMDALERAIGQMARR